jgi:hypothetical protein
MGFFAQKYWFFVVVSLVEINSFLTSLIKLVTRMEKNFEIFNVLEIYRTFCVVF